MENKHTPGPWIVNDWSFSGWSVRSKIGLAISSKSYRNELTGQEYRDEMLANAHLIAAAPELLEALKEAQRMILDQGTKGRIPATYENHMITVRIARAIEKATGEVE